jgi:hypothetical protein
MILETMVAADVEQERRDRVAIAAAVSAVVGRRVRIGAVTACPAPRAGEWTREGRLVSMARVAPKDGGRRR